MSNHASFRQERNNNVLLVGTDGRKRIVIHTLVKVRANEVNFSGRESAGTIWCGGLEAAVQLKSVGNGRPSLLGCRRCEGEFETAAIVGHSRKTFIRGKDKRMTYRFVRHGIYDYAADGLGVGGVLCCQAQAGGREKCYSQGDRCYGAAARNGRALVRTSRAHYDMFT